MLNKERWLEYTSGLSSPQSYIDWVWRYIVAASLQRRVWLGPEHQPCFPNVYCILVGAPGVGKGLAIREASDFLKFWSLDDFIKMDVNGNQDFQSKIDLVLEADKKNASDAEMQSKNGKMEFAKPRLIPVAADATTYEALVSAVAKGYRRINYIYDDIKTGKKEMGIYGHSSICFSLQELSSLLRKRTHDTVNYMLGLYDCPVDYEYDTKTQGRDRVRRGCLNLLAGTTPSFMRTIFDESLVDEGFTSRTFFIYAQKNRANHFWIPPLSSTQQEHKKVLLEHVRKLTALYGNVKMTDEIKTFLAEWWDDFCNNKVPVLTQKYPKLIHFLSRMNIHVMKTAMAEFFGENTPNPHLTDVVIPIEYYKTAIDVLDNEMKNMQVAITMEGDNILSKIARKILDYLQNGRKNETEILIAMYGAGNAAQQQEALSFLIDTKQIVSEQDKDPDLPDNLITYYKLKGQEK